MNVFYSPGGFKTQMLLGDVTLGPILANRVGGNPPTAGTMTTSVGQQPPILGIYPPSYGNFPAFNIVGKIADAGEIADCLNQLVLRIQALEAAMALSSAYGIVQT